MRKLLLALAVCLCFCGCMRSTQLQDRAIVQGLGVDFKNGIYEVTFQIFNPEGSSGNNSFDNTKTNNVTVATKGHTISQAFSEVNLILGKRPFLGNNMYIAVGRSAAEAGMSYIIDFFNSYYETRSTTYLFMADEEASKVVSSQIKVGIVPASAIANIAEECNKAGTLHFTNIFEVIQAMKTPGKDVAIPVVTVEQDVRGNPLPLVKGAALLLEGKLVGELDLKEAYGVQLARGKVRSGIVAAQDESLGKIAMVIHNNKSRITYRMEDGFPVYTLDIRVEGNINEMVGSLDQDVQEQDVPKIEGIFEKEISSIVAESLRHTVYREGVDLFSLGRRLYKYDSAYWDQVKGSWVDTIKKSSFKVLVRVDVESLGPAANVKTYE